MRNPSISLQWMRSRFSLVLKNKIRRFLWSRGRSIGSAHTCPKVVGVGLNKTGTTTLGVCLQHWGFKHITSSKMDFELWSHGDWSRLIRRVGQYDSFEDWPWALIYREIDGAFPGSKFILTRRTDPETWFTSLSKHADRTGPTVYRERIYGFSTPYDHQTEHISFYTQHNEAVRSYFAGRPDDLLEVCWEEGDGWEELATFLGMRPPTLPFPHANRFPCP